MKIAVTGSTGLIGSALVPFLTTAGHEVWRVVRTQPAEGEQMIFWHPAEGEIFPAAFDGFDAVVHLAGESIAAGRWTKTRKQRIRDSRVEGTRLLSQALAGLHEGPTILVCASAIGYYGNREDEALAEDSPPGEGFLADVCQDWETAAEPAREKGIRVVHTRFGVVLSPNGGALQKMLLPFKMGVGGIVGDGRQFWSWVALDDVVAAIHHAITHDELSGPVNVVAPNPATNREFTKALGKVLGRPTLLPMPAFAARLVLGEMADELLLASARVEPVRLKESGYEFQCPQLDPALRHLLGK